MWERKEGQVEDAFARPCVHQPPPTLTHISLSSPHSTNFDPNPAGDTVILSSGTANVTAANSTDLTVNITSAPTTGPLNATVSAFGAQSSPTIFAYLTSGAGNNVTSCTINDLRTAVNTSTCIPATTSVTAPSAVALANGYAYVASSTGGTVAACTISYGTFIGCVSTVVSTTAGVTLSDVTLDPAGANLYATDSTNGEVVACAVSGTSITGCSVQVSTTTLSSLVGPVAIAVSTTNAYVTTTSSTGGLIVCTATAGALSACALQTNTAISTATGLNFFSFDAGGVTKNALYTLNAGTDSWADCDLGASAILGTCTAATSTAYPTGGSPAGLAAISTLLGGEQPTLFVALAAAVNKNCDTTTDTCTAMSFGFSNAIAVGWFGCSIHLHHEGIHKT